MASDHESRRDFDSLEPVDSPEAQDDSEDDWVSSEEMAEEGWTIVGEVVRIDENRGDYDSRLYEIRVDLGETRLMWGRTSIDRKVDSAGIGPGDVIGIRNTGDEFETENGSGYVFDVRELKDKTETED
jgi:hypothetical protein